MQIIRCTTQLADGKICGAFLLEATHIEGRIKCRKCRKIKNLRIVSLLYENREYGRINKTNNIRD